MDIVQSIGLQSQTQLSDFHFLSLFLILIYLRCFPIKFLSEFKNLRYFILKINLSPLLSFYKKKKKKTYSINAEKLSSASLVPGFIRNFNQEKCFFFFFFFSGSWTKLKAEKHYKLVSPSSIHFYSCSTKKFSLCYCNLIKVEKIEFPYFTQAN